ncbi:MAG: DUF1097 domain-containing protein [Croceibacterium sp.]
MSAYLALTVAVGVLAVLDTWLFGLAALAAFGLQVWISFISWGTHFQAGGKATGTITAIACMSFGALVGMVAVILAGGAFAGLGTMAVPVAVGLGAAVIVLASKVPYLGIPPIGFYGFASIAAVILLKDVEATDALVPVVISIIIGALFGFVSEIITNAMTKPDGETAEAAADPGHA